MVFKKGMNLDFAETQRLPRGGRVPQQVAFDERPWCDSSAVELSWRPLLRMPRLGQHVEHAYSDVYDMRAVEKGSRDRQSRIACSKHSRSGPFPMPILSD